MILTPEQQSQYNALIRLRDSVAHAYHSFRVAKVNEQREAQQQLAQLRIDFVHQLNEVFNVPIDRIDKLCNPSDGRAGESPQDQS